MKANERTMASVWTREYSATYAGLLMLSMSAPYVFRSPGLQPVTGTIVNASLFLAAAQLDLGAALSIAVFPSLVALLSGQLPPILAPMVPFIMFGNVVLVLAFRLLRKVVWIGMVSAASLKAFVIFGASLIVIPLLALSPEVAGKVLTMMGVFQLGTALAGGVIACGILAKKSGSA